MEAKRRHSQLLEEAKERGLLLSHSIAMENYKDRAEKVGVREFLSRLQMLLQEPIVVVILLDVPSETRDQLSGSPDYYRVLYHTMLDPLWKDQFESRLRDENLRGEVVGNNIFLPRDACSGNVLKIDDCHHALFFRMGLGNIDTNSVLPFVPFEENSDVSLREFLKYFKQGSNLYNALVSDGLSGELDKRSSEEYWSRGSIILKEPTVDLSYGFGLENVDSQTLMNFYDESFKRISAVFDVCYEKVCGSSLIKINNFQPPNMMFAVRFFENTENRFSGSSGNSPMYPYGVRGLLPKQQKLDVTNSLEILRKIQTDKRFSAFARANNPNTFYFPKPDSRIKSYAQLRSEDFPRGGNSHFKGDSDFFWDLICSDKDLGVIIDEMEKPYSLSARALSDIVFSGGFVRVAPEPYVKARGVRLDYSVYIKGARELDFRKNVYYHYIMTMAARGGGGMSSLLVPGAVNGTPWFSMGYYFTSGQPEHERWLNCYHFFHSVARFFIRGVRKRLRCLYLDEVERIYAEILYTVIPEKFPQLPLESYPKLVNPYLHLLCRVYPYDLVSLRFVSKDSSSGSLKGGARVVDGSIHHITVGSERYLYRVHSSENPYFESFTRAQYHSVESVVTKLNAAAARFSS